MRTPREMLDARRQDPTVRGIDWELEGTVSVGEQIYAREGVDDPPTEHFEALMGLLNDEVEAGLWPIEEPDLEGRQRAGIGALILLSEGGGDRGPTVH